MADGADKNLKVFAKCLKLMKVGHVGMEKGLGNPVVVLRVSPPLCI